MKGLFITIEGPDGSGKTSLINELYPLLKIKTKLEIVKTREPGGSEISEKIRNIILDAKNKKMDPKTEVLLYTASRRQHLTEIILPALKQKKIVLCDRFVDSSLAYQGYGHFIGIQKVAKINEFATEGITPDLTLYLDIDVVIGLNRVFQDRVKGLDRLELNGLDFHKRVRKAYLKIQKRNDSRIHFINAENSLREVVNTSFSKITKIFPKYFEGGIEK